MYIIAELYIVLISGFIYSKQQYSAIQCNFFLLKHVFCSLFFSSCSIHALKTAKRQMTQTRGLRSLSRIAPTQCTPTCPVSLGLNGRRGFRILACLSTSHPCDVFAFLSSSLSCLISHFHNPGNYFQGCKNSRNILDIILFSLLKYIFISEFKFSFIKKAIYFSFLEMKLILKYFVLGLSFNRLD